MRRALWCWSLWPVLLPVHLSPLDGLSVAQVPDCISLTAELVSMEESSDTTMAHQRLRWQIEDALLPACRAAIEDLPGDSVAAAEVLFGFGKTARLSGTVFRMGTEEEKREGFVADSLHQLAREDALLKAVRLNPSHPRASLQLADVMQRRGRGGSSISPHLGRHASLFEDDVALHWTRRLGPELLRCPSLWGTTTGSAVLL